MKLEGNNDNKKNIGGLIVVGILLLMVGGVSFAYFVSNVLSGGRGASTSGTTAVIKGTTLNVEGTLDFNDTGFLPGHKNVSAIKVTATGNNELIPYNLIWSGTNNISKLNYTVYKTSSEVNVSATCNKETKVENGKQYLSEACTLSNQENLGSAIASGSINKGDTKVTLAKDEFITAKTTGDSWYYYVILEYPNLEEDQSADIGQSINGRVTVEESNVKPDINILATYIEQEEGTYKQQDDIPQSGYTLNTEKSTCSNGATPRWENNELIVSSLTKSGTSCYLYFGKSLCNGNACNSILASYQSRGKISTARSGAITVDTEMENDKLYSVADDYGTSYVYAGTNPNNYVQLGGFWWRIIRINGDGTIRLIYNGTSSTATGVGTQIQTSYSEDNIVQQYNANGNHNAYVGYMYGSTATTGSTYENTHTNTTSSTIKKDVDSWYSTYLDREEIKEKIDNSGTFCNDRKVDKTAHSNYQGDGTGTTQTGYVPWGRLYTNGNWKTSQTPSLKCSQSNDVFTTSESSRGNKELTYPVGLIMSDEVVLAGGFGGTARTFWLNTGQTYWTMSPCGFDGSSASMFDVNSSGRLDGHNVYNLNGVRPVINLKADTVFKTGGTGTADNPYVVQ